MPYKDKNKQREYQRRHTLKNPYRHKTRRLERKEWFYSLIKDNKCLRCSYDSLVCLDFHHVNPNEKHDEVTKMLHEFRSKESILTEMKKCVILCSNCHRELHAGLWNLSDLE